MQVMDGLFDDLRVLEKEQQLELQELETLAQAHGDMGAARQPTEQGGPHSY